MSDCDDKCGKRQFFVPTKRNQPYPLLIQKRHRNRQEHEQQSNYTQIKKQWPA